MTPPRRDWPRGQRGDAPTAEPARAADLDEAVMGFLHDGDLERLLDAVMTQALAVTGADRGCLHLAGPAGGGFRLAAQRGIAWPLIEYVASLRAGIAGPVGPGAERVVVDDVATSPLLTDDADRAALGAAGVRALHVTPLRTRAGQVVGLLSTLHREPPSLGAPEHGALDRLADVAAGAIARARAAERGATPQTETDIAAELRRTEALFRSTVENVPVTMVLCDHRGCVLYINPALAEMVKAVCGLGLGEVVGRWGGEIWPPHVWSPFQQHLEKAMASGQRQTYELATTRPDGEPQRHHWIVVPLAGEGGEVDRVLGISQDVTAERRLVDELREADRSKGEFIGVLSHELRNPLAAIRASLHVIEREDMHDDARARARRDDARAMIDRQVGHLVRMVDDLLDVTRISQSKIQLRRRRLDLARLVDESIEDSRAHLEASGVALRAELPPAPLLASVDAVRIAQVVANLLANCAKFTPSGGQASLSLTAEAGAAVLTVADTGCGIDAALLPRVFEPFMQGERSLDREGGGLGLGLALVRGVVELHGGQVSASSPGPGQGATFVVRLPLEPSDGLAEDEPEAPPPGAPRARRPRRVLVIEDDRHVAHGLALALGLDGHEVAVAHDGPGGFEKARAFAPEVVLCDIGLPGMDGYEVARALRADAALRSVTLIALTGYAQASDRDLARAAGFDEHVAKPASIEALLALLAR
jgi:PAS domain S-box-containing protein